MSYISGRKWDLILPRIEANLNLRGDQNIKVDSTWRRFSLGGCVTPLTAGYLGTMISSIWSNGMDFHPKKTLGNRWRILMTVLSFSRNFSMKRLTNFKRNQIGWKAAVKINYYCFRNFLTQISNFDVPSRLFFQVMMSASIVTSLILCNKNVSFPSKIQVYFVYIKMADDGFIFG